MRAYTVKVIDAAGRFHRYTQLSTNTRAAENVVWRRFGVVRMLSIVKASAFALPHGQSHV